MHISTNLSLQVSSSYQDPTQGALYFNNFVYAEIQSGEIANY